jgi:hypothetical protein
VTLISNALPYNVVVAPVLTSINPAQKPIDSGVTALVCTGSGFVQGCQVYVDHAPYGSSSTTWTSATQCSLDTLYMTLPIGPHDISVMNPDGQESNAVVFTSLAHAPVLSSVTPNPTTTPGADAITVNGADFQNGAVVIYHGNDRATTFVSATQLNSNTMDWAAGTYNVNVRNPDGQLGNIVTHRIQEPTPTLTSLSPNTIPQGGTHRVNFTGTGFRGSTGLVTQSGYWANHTCWFTSPTTGYYDANLISTSPSTQVSVANTTGNTAYSNSLPLYMGYPPNLTDESPKSVDSSNWNTYTLSGSNFVQGQTRVTARDTWTSSGTSPDQVWTEANVQWVNSNQIKVTEYDDVWLRPGGGGGGENGWSFIVNTPFGQDDLLGIQEIICWP